MLSRDFISLLGKIKEVKCERVHAGKCMFFEAGGHIYFFTLYLCTEGTDSRRTFGSGRLAVIDRVEPVISV